jgi:acyl-CoA thioester hydrolase
MTEPDTELPMIRTDRVRFAETDAQGIVFYGTYFTYLDEAFNAYLREIEYRYDRMHAEGWTTHVAHAHLDYHAAARFEEVIESRLAVVEIGETSFTAAFEA